MGAYRGMAFNLRLTRSSRQVGQHVNAKTHQQTKFGKFFWALRCKTVVTFDHIYTKKYTYNYTYTCTYGHDQSLDPVLRMCAQDRGTRTDTAGLAAKLRRPKWLKIHSCKSQHFAEPQAKPHYLMSLITMHVHGLDCCCRSLICDGQPAMECISCSQVMNVDVIFRNWPHTLHLTRLMLTCFRRHCRITTSTLKS